MPEGHDRLARILAELTLEEKVALVSGADFWTTTTIDRVGLRAMVLSDGPSGVRGPVWDERSPSLNLPSGTALAAAWDPELAYAYGAVAAAEARRKGVDVVLGPTINLHRSPLGGRHFEAFSEDPLLTGQLAAAYVRGLQDNGVAATPKHYVANDSETDRFSVNVTVDERTLREVYLLPFELATESRPWALMSAYNSVGGVTMSENDLLEDPLNSEWGFDGVVVSDWFAVRSTVAATAAQDLAMPGPAQAWSAALVQAVKDGVVERSSIDRKVLRMLQLAARVGALADSTAVTPAAIDGREFARKAAAEGAVLLVNREELPWSADALRSVAVIGQNARDARTQGGGSATVIPTRVVSPLDGIRAALPNAAVSYAMGAIVHDGVSELPLGSTRNPVTGETGVRVTFLSSERETLYEEDRKSSALVWFATDVPLNEARWIVLETELTPDVDGALQLGFAATKHGRVFVDDVLVIDEVPELTGGDPGAALLDPPSVTVGVASTLGVTLRIRAEFDMHTAADDIVGAAAITVGLAPQPTDSDELIARAVETARTADVAIVVVGTNSDVESEGYDRTSLDLPGRQDDLVRAVAAANPRTVVIVNAGSPVLLPWRNEVAAIVMGYFGGQEFGSAIADVVFGTAEPGGRLTTTWPAALSDVPVLEVVPAEGILDYAEGIHVGYRAWLRHGIEPAYPFGWGLGYTTWEVGDLELSGALDSDDLSASVTATNTGSRPGKQVLQVYAERPDSSLDRPVRWLVGSAVVRLQPGESGTVIVPLPARRFMHWVGARDGGWQLEAGEFTLRVGTSVADVLLSGTTAGTTRAANA